jgi:hypothetical protein
LRISAVLKVGNRRSDSLRAVVRAHPEPITRRSAMRWVGVAILGALLTGGRVATASKKIG